MIKICICLLLLLSAINAYSPPQALEMIYMSAATYYSQDAIDNWSCPQCAKYNVVSPQAFYKSSSNTQGFTGYLKHQSAIIIAFRGSTDIKNWLTNLNTIRESYSGCSECSVHVGFNSAYQGVADIVRARVQQLLSVYPSAKIFVTGHSLGGALAVLCALDLKNIYGRVDQLITMGQPRVGNANFAQFLTSSIPNTFRVIDYADTVVHAPPSAFGFKHGGREIWYNPRGMQYYQDCQSQDKSCANSISTIKFSTSDHSIENYMAMKTTYSLFDRIFHSIGQFFKNLFSFKPKQYSAEQLSQMQLNNYNNIIEQLQAESKPIIQDQTKVEQQLQIEIS